MKATTRDEGDENVLKESEEFEIFTDIELNPVRIFGCSNTFDFNALIDSRDEELELNNKQRETSDEEYKKFIAELHKGQIEQEKRFCERGAVILNLKKETIEAYCIRRMTNGIELKINKI